MATLPANISIPAQRQALEEAAHWYARLCSGSADHDDDQALQNWLNHDALNQWAWSKIDQLQKRLGRLPGSLALDTLERTDRDFNRSRRAALKGLVLLLGTGTLGWAGYRYDPLKLLPMEQWLADAHTLTGQVKTLTLDDGSTLTLNTASAVDILFTESERRILLRQGEIMIETAKDNLTQSASRPFIVETAYGQVRALGTRFSVRDVDHDHGTQLQAQVNVYEHSVEVTTKQGEQALCPAGNGLYFSTETISPLSEAVSSDAWTQSMLVVDSMRLDEFLNELSRYRTGVLRCDPAVAHHRISGAFNTSDTDQALRAIEKSFSVTVNYRSRYWVSVTL